MSNHRRFVQFIIAIITISTLTFSGVRPSPVQAQANDGLKRQLNAQSGRISFIGPETGQAISALKALGTSLRPPDPALALAKRFAPEFGLKHPERDLSEIKKNKLSDGRVTVRYQQKYQGIPVIAGELIVNTNENGDLYSMAGEISPDLALPTQPTIDSEQATQTALRALALGYQKTPADFVASTPELWIYDESLLRPGTAPAELVWRLEVVAKDNRLPIRELVLVNARRGHIRLHFNQVDTASAWEHHAGTRPAKDSIQITPSTLAPTRGKFSEGFIFSPAVSQEMQLLSAPLVSTYTAENTSSLPGTFLCDQTDPDCTSGDDHAKAAHRYAIGTADLYSGQFNRASIDNNGMTIVSTVHYCDLEDPIFGCPYVNAFWSGSQMVYGDAFGFALADDVVAHELTHGITQHESNLFYYYQSGAINESFSDLFGEYYDQINGQGNDDASIEWRIGEDVTELENPPSRPELGLRDMRDPGLFDDPDRISSPNYYKEEADNGGVHYNSGINNKAVYLMVDGGTFNGKTVTALGWDKVSAIYYEVNTNLLTSGSDYSDLYYTLQQACANLLGQHGIISSDCTQVKNAADAVEMNGQPEPNFNTDAPLCSDGSSVNTSFYDGLENGLSNWTFDNGTYTRWQLDSPDGAYARSGLHSLFANGQPSGVTDATARLVSIVIPANGYLHFAQAYGFATLFGIGYYFDGGVLEYSTNGGDTWADAGALIDYNGYKDIIFTDFGNPLAGRLGFVGASHGYISTRLNLSSLAGQSVTFRWRMGMGDFNFFGDSWGWWLDDIRVFNCTAPMISGNAGVAGAMLRYMDGTLQTVTADGSGNYSITVPTGWSGTVRPYKSGYTFSPSERAYSNVQSNQTGQDYTAQVCLGCTDVDVHIAGNLMGGYTIPVGGRVSPIYNNINNGPVQVVSTNGANIIVSERAYRGLNFTDWNEMLGFPAEQLTTEYWFPLCDGTGGAQTFISIGNASQTPADVTVKIAGQILGNYTIPVGGRVTPECPGINNGPVQVYSTNGTDIIVSERAYRGANFTDWNEMLGFPVEQLTTEYWFPLCDGTGTAQTFISIGNASQTPAQVTVKIAGQILGSYTIPVGGRVTPNCAGINNGPVQVYSTNGTDIIVSERAYRGANYTDWNEMLGLPVEQLTTEYWFPLCDGTGIAQTFISIGNASQTAAQVTVKIAGQPFGNYTIPVGGRVTPMCAGINNGPVQVYSTNGTDIIVSERAYRGLNYTDWNEMLGLPVEQLTTEYWFPLYDTTGSAQTFVTIGAP